jgi:hypothetical protein
MLSQFSEVWNLLQKNSHMHKFEYMITSLVYNDQPTMMLKIMYHTLDYASTNTLVMHVKSLMTYIGLDIVDEWNVIFILLNASTRKAMEDIQIIPMVVFVTIIFGGHNVLSPFNYSNLSHTFF